MAGNGATTTGPGVAGSVYYRNNARKKIKKPIDKKTKSITYSTDTPDLLLDLNSTASATVSKTASIEAVKVKNVGYVSAVAIFAFNRYSAEDTVSGTEYLQYLLNPNEEIMLPTTRAIITDAVNEWDGTVVTTTAPHADIKVTTGNTVTSGEMNNTTDPVVFQPNGGEGAFRVGDMIRIENEICEVLGVYGDNPTTSTVADDHIVVKRGLHGSTNASHSGTPTIYFSIHNEHHAYNKYSQVQTDSLGRYNSSNLYGYGRANSGQGGITPGSVAIQFYTQGKAIIPIGDASSNTESGLAASTEYGFDITVDGSGNLTSDYMKFTTSTNTKFGGSDGVIQKMQDALDTYYYTTGSNILNERVTISIENGDIVFTSGTFLSSSAILLAAPSAGETTPFGVGRIPAIGSVVAYNSRLESEKTYDDVTGGSVYKDIYIRDDGNGNLVWKNTRVVGKINYETGAHHFKVSERPNAEYVFSLLHTGPFSGKQDPITTGRKNALVQVLGNTTQQKCEAKLAVTTY